MGPVNAAHAVTLFLATTGARSIVVCGVGGAYPGSGLHIGDVVCAGSECYGDLGATSPSGFLDMKALGFPVIEKREQQAPLFNELPMQIFPVERRVPFVTMTACTGTDAAARAIEQRTGGAVESMEGRRWPTSRACTIFRWAKCAASATSSPIATHSAWKLKEAAVAAQEAVVSWIIRR